MTVEYSTNASTRSALRGLAESSGHSLDYLCLLAARGELARVFAGGQVFRHLAKPDDDPGNDLTRALARRSSPREALLVLMAKRW
jgi:hypothetical protein